jgi:hypothetical protein
MKASVRPFVVVAALALVQACRGSAPIAPVVLPPPMLPAPSVMSYWAAAQSNVLQLVNENRSSAAESSLSQFSHDFPRTLEGDRARWWRTLMRAEGRISGGDASLAIAQIDSLLADSIAIDVRAEAAILRRSINAIDSARRSEVRRRTQATQLASDRQDQVNVVRDSMLKLSAEIERLRKRLRNN